MKTSCKMHSFYMRIKSYVSNADFTAQRINYVQVNNSLLLKILMVECFVLICIFSCILFYMVTSEVVKKEINLQMEKENKETMHSQGNVFPLENDNKTIQASRLVKNTDDSKHEKRNNETSYFKEERLRVRRDENKIERSQRRQKKHKKNKRRNNGVLVARFNGAKPDLLITNEVLIGPWMKSTEMNNQFDFTNFHLVEEKKAIEVNKSGLYMITVQIAYTGNSAPNSYRIVLSSEGDSGDKKIAVCSTNNTDSTCFTSTIKYLKKKDRIRIQQREKNRSINLRTPLSFIEILYYGESTKES